MKTYSFTISIVRVASISSNFKIIIRLHTLNYHDWVFFSKENEIQVHLRIAKVEIFISRSSYEDLTVERFELMTNGIAEVMKTEIWNEDSF